MNICGPLAKPCGTSKQPHTVCQELANSSDTTGFAKGLGTLPKGGGLAPNYGRYNWQTGKSTIQAIMRTNPVKAERDGCHRGRTARIMFECPSKRDMVSGLGTPTFIQELQSTCEYIFLWKTQYVICTHTTVSVSVSVSVSSCALGIGLPSIFSVLSISMRQCLLQNQV